MNPDGTNQPHIPNTELYDESPSWSPGGTRLCFVRQGGGKTRLTHNDKWDAEPCWRAP